MFQNKNQRPTSFKKYFTQDKMLLFGTIFFVTSVVLLTGMFLFPSVRTMLHDSALATGLVPGGILSGEPAPSSIFKDVNSNHPNAAAIAYLKEKHIISGYADGTFKPDDFVARAELLKFLFESQKVYPSPAVYRACFKDVKDEWFAPYVCYAKAKGLVGGYSDGTFGPGNKVTVAEALKIVLLEHHLKLLDGPPLEDMQFDAKAWYAPYIWTAYGTNLVTWNNPPHPQQLPDLTNETAASAMLPRAQLAEILYRLLK